MEMPGFHPFSIQGQVLLRDNQSAIVGIGQTLEEVETVLDSTDEDRVDGNPVPVGFQDIFQILNRIGDASAVWLAVTDQDRDAFERDLDGNRSRGSVDFLSEDFAH